MAHPPAYAELHCHSNFSFLDGASHPEELVAEATRLALSGLALTDRDGLYGVVRFAEAAREAGLPGVFGAELTLGPPAPDPARESGAVPSGAVPPGGGFPGEGVVVLAEGPLGYARLARAVSTGQLAGSKGSPRTSLSALAEAAVVPVQLHPRRSRANDAWFVLTGGRQGGVPKAVVERGPAAARRILEQLTEAFGRDRVLVEVWDHGDPLDRPRNDVLAELAVRAGVGLVATNDVRYATPARRPLADALAAIRAGRCLDALDGWLPASPHAHLRSPIEQLRRFANYPGAVDRAGEVARQAAFDLHLAAPRLPGYPVPPGHTEITWLRELAWSGAEVRYPPEHPSRAEARRRIASELEIVDALGFAGYFLLVFEIVEFCRRQNIYCQGRGSAANSAVCYALGITRADAVGLGLLFERFLSPERDGPPDIDLDIEHRRREEVIQHVYDHYGRDRAALVANVITYRPRSAIREMAKACGLSSGQADAAAKAVEGWTMEEALEEAGGVPEVVPPLVLDLASQVQGFPRHLGIHPGGMVIADRPLVEFCPVEWARMADRSVLQWDKDDCAAAGLVKFDLLGLGMLTVLHSTVDLVSAHEGVEIDLATIPQQERVYDLLCAADTVGVFQVESRAQMATLPRLRPRSFYDLVVEVALIRPGPIQGDSVHPYLRRRNGEEPVTYLHPLLERSLAKTLGVPLFQEQLMQMAIDVAGFTPAEADRLRQAMGSKRSRDRMAALRNRLLAGMARNGIGDKVAEAIAAKLEAFADFGFPESHSVSFAYLVYASAWLKLHHPAAFTAALLNAQPMGFYSPHTIVRDAARHGVVTLPPGVNVSGPDATLERRDGQDGRPEGLGHPQAGWHADPTPFVVRLGFRSVRGLGEALLARVEAEREQGEFRGLEDFGRRSGASAEALESLATAGAFAGLGLSRRGALWGAGGLRDARPDRLPGLATGLEAPRLPGMTPVEEAAADLWALGLSPGTHPTEFVREALRNRGAVTVAGLRSLAHGSVVEVGGVVTHRQRPSTAKGVVFLSVEDETGLLNVICSKGVWRRYRPVARLAPAVVVRGVLERRHEVVTVVAQRLEALTTTSPPRSRDFR